MEINEVKSNFIKRGFNFEYFEDCESAVKFVTELIPKKSAIGFGGSNSVVESGLLDALVNDDYNLLHRDICLDIDKDVLMQKMHLADWYICSSNAVSVTGELINIDGRGNRVGEVLNGPKNIVFICGVNKLVDSISEGIDRVRNIASPPICVRLKKKTPCAVTGICSYCNSPDTICKATVILHHPTTGRNIHIIMINKNLGF